MDDKKQQIKHNKPSPPQPTEPLKPHDWIVLAGVLIVPIFGLWVIASVDFLSKIFSAVVTGGLFFLISIWFFRNIIGIR